MKKIIWCAVLLGAVTIPVVSLAAEFRVGERVSLPESESLNENAYLAGGSVTSSGKIVGDLVTAGGSVVVRSEVGGDVTAGGGNVSILGDVYDDVRVGGGNLNIQGGVSGDLLAGGGQVMIGGSGVGGDLIVGGGLVQIEAPVGGDARIGAGELYINARIAGNVEAWTDKVTLGPDAEILGNFTYTSKKEAIMEEGAIVNGETKFTESKRVKGIGKKGVAAFLLWGLFSGFVMMLAGALVVVYVLRRYSEVLVRTATDKPLLEIGRGFVFSVVTPAASIVLLFTVIGVPLGVLGLIAFAGIILFAVITAPIIVGSVVHKWLFKPADYQVSWKTVLLGAVVLLVLKVIPFIGWVAAIVVALLTIGASVNIKQKALEEWR